MVHLCQRGGADFKTRDPAVFREAGSHFAVFIFHASGGRHGYGLGNFHHGIRRAHRPFLRPDQGHRRFGRIACGTVPAQPCQERSAVGFGKGPVISPGDGVLSGLRRGEPRGHDALGDHLFDHRGVPGHVFHFNHLKGAGATGPVAFLTIPLDDPRNVPVPCQGGRGRCGRLFNFQRTTRCGSGRKAGPLLGSHRRQGIGEVVLGGLVFLIAYPVLVIHRAPVMEREGPVDQEDFGGGFSLEHLQQTLLGVGGEKPVQRMFLRQRRERFRRVGGDRSNKNELDALGSPGVFQSG